MSGWACVDTPVFPDEGTLVSTRAGEVWREPGSETEQYVDAGTVGIVRGHVEEWHDVHVEVLGTGQHFWIDPCLIRVSAFDLSTRAKAEEFLDADA
jgi:hypothetical protein